MHFRLATPIGLVLLLCGIDLSLAGAASTDSSVETSAGRLAVIESVLGPAQGEPDAEVVRSGGAESEPAQVSMPLYLGDQVKTGENTRVVVLFLEAATETDREVTVDANSRVTIKGESSILASVGRVFAQLRGQFEVELPRILLGAFGTEFQLELAENGDANLIVLEGTVNVQPKIEGQESQPPASRPAPSTSGAAESSANPAVSEQDVVRVEFGSKATFQKSIDLINTCQKRHRFEIAAATNLAWVQLPSDLRIELSSGERQSVYLELQMDARSVAAGRYTVEIPVSCEGCSSEPNCRVSWVEPLRIPVEVLPPLRVNQLGGALLRSGAPLPTASEAATEVQVREALDWTNEVLLAVQPSYSAEGLVPRYKDESERSEAFKTARYDALWKRSPEGYQAMGGRLQRLGRRRPRR